MLILYHQNISTCAQKVRLQLTEKGLDWTGVNVDMMAGDHLTPEFRKLSPRNLIPVLVHDGEPVWESSVILEFLEDRFPTPSLRPENLLQRAAMRRWVKAPDDGLHNACGTLTYAAVFGEQVKAYNSRRGRELPIANLEDKARAERQRQLFALGMRAPIVADSIRYYDRVLESIERNLARNKWLAGEHFSLADIAIVPYVIRLDRLGLDAMWAERPSLADWYRRACSRPSHAQAIAAYPPESTENAYNDDAKALGIELWPQVREILARVDPVPSS